MCGRFVAASDPEGLIRFLMVDDRRAPDLPANYNVAPTQDVYAAAVHDDRRYLVAFRWGLVPSWADDPRVGARMINARAETLAERPAFREAFQARRCLIPADGYYEWKVEGGRKVPHFIHRMDGQPIAFAGLWASWRDRDDPTTRLRTCTIITREADPAIRSLHDRMPVALPQDVWTAWLDPATDEIELRAALAEAGPRLEFRAVSERVNNHRNNGPELLTPAA